MCLEFSTSMDINTPYDLKYLWVCVFVSQKKKEKKRKRKYLRGENVGFGQMMCAAQLS